VAMRKEKSYKIDIVGFNEYAAQKLAEIWAEAVIEKAKGQEKSGYLPTPVSDNIKACELKKSGLSYCDPEVEGADYVIIDTSLQPQPDKLVLGVSDGEKAIKRFGETSKDDHIVGVVTETISRLTKL